MPTSLLTAPGRNANTTVNRKLRNLKQDVSRVDKSRIGLIVTSNVP